LFSGSTGLDILFCVDIMRAASGWKVVRSVQFIQSFPLESHMQKLIIAALVSFLAANAAFSADDCAARAAEKKLAGAAKNSFMKKCEKDAAGSAAPACEARAAEKKLAGAAKNSFVKKCEKDAAALAAPSCEARAAEKKLAGAAKNSFVTKCEKDAATAK